eukprot:gene9932-2253_t
MKVNKKVEKKHSNKGFSLKKFGSSAAESSSDNTSFMNKAAAIKNSRIQDHTDYQEIFNIGTNIQDDGPTHVILNFNEAFFKSIDTQIHSIREESEVSENKIESVKDKIKMKIDEKVYKEGWMVKEGRIHKNWKKRWFILNGPSLNYYTARNNKSKGSIPLESCSVQIVSGNDRPDGKTCLMITNNGVTDEDTTQKRQSMAKGGKDKDDDDDKPERVLYFDVSLEKGEKGEPDELRAEWLNAISTRISILQYTKKCRQKKMNEDIDLLEFFTKGSSATEVHVNKPLIIEGVIAMVDPLKDHQNLKVLDFSGAQIGNEGLLTLLPALESNGSITHLNFSDCGIGFSSLSEFSKKILEKKYTIKSLNLSHNNINEEALSEFSKSLAKNKGLTELNLNNNSFGGEKMEEFVDALLNNSEIKIPKLYLNNNQISDVGCAALAKLLSSKYVLKELHVTHNKIGNEGSKLLAKSLSKNKELAILNMESNEIGYAGAKQLAFMIVSNSTIEKLLLGGNRLGEQALLLLGDTNMQFPELELKQMF